MYMTVGKVLRHLGMIPLFSLLFVGDALAQEQNYPNKPVRMLVGFAPGGSTDVAARLVGRKLGEHLGQPVIVENRSASSGTIAIQMVSTSPPDGYTILMLAASQVIQSSLVTKLPYDLLRDLTPVSLIVTGPGVLVVNASLPAENIETLIAYVRSQPGKLNYGSDGVGGGLHLAGELFKMMAKVDIVHVPYKGGSEGAVAAASGQIQMAFSSIPAALPLISGGKLRVLAVTSLKRASLMPDVPTLNEAGLSGYGFSSWQGVVAPAGLPVNLIARLNMIINKAVNTQEMKEALSKQGREVDTGTPEQFGAFLHNEIEKNTRLIKFVGLKVE